MAELDDFTFYSLSPFFSLYSHKRHPRPHILPSRTPRHLCRACQHRHYNYTGLQRGLPLLSPYATEMDPPPELHTRDSSASASSGESDVEPTSAGHHHRVQSYGGDGGQFTYSASAAGSMMEDEVPPMAGHTAGYAWPASLTAGVPPALRSRSSVGANGAFDGPSAAATASSQQPNGMGMAAGRPHRPTAVRTPSNAYAPQRRPTQFPLGGGANGNATSTRHRNSSRGRRNPNAEYRAQEKAYVQRIRQDFAEPDDFFSSDLRTPSLGYSTDSETDDDSPSAAEYPEGDPYDQETLLYYGNDEMTPSVEELKIPANRERLEWHSMLASVLTGDVVKQEKKRLIGGIDHQGDNALKTELWVGIRAKVCGRTLQAQRRMLEDKRSRVKAQVEGIIGFEIKGEAEVGKTPLQQVEEVCATIEKCESLYPNQLAFHTANSRAASAAYRETSGSVVAWLNTMQLLNTELGILRSWVGNDELDFTRPKTRPASDGRLADESSFIDRLLKEDGLKSLTAEKSLLDGLNLVIYKAKHTLIANAEGFAARHLPPYIEELLTLINFPSRLIQEIIRVRLSYAKKVKDPAQQGVIMAEQMITQFQVLLNLATHIKESYTAVSQPEPGWEPPPCIEENFDTTVLDALKFYFKMLNWKLSANKNTFKEAEILEQEWDFSSKLSRYLDGGDVEVAEQFSALTSKSLARLTTHFEKELSRRPDELTNADMDKRYRQILDSVRVRQRKLFRFQRILTTRFENSTEYNINIDQDQLVDLYEALAMSGHFLVETGAGVGADGIGTYIIASPALQDRPKDIQSLLTTCYHTEESPGDPSNPYILVLKPEHPIVWEGRRMVADVRQPYLDVKQYRLRLVADGSQMQLTSANLSFAQAVNMELAQLIEQRANLPRVNAELQKIKKTAWKLSTTIMDSVEIVRRQTAGLDSQELIQTCFAFATEFGQRSLLYLDHNRRAMNNLKMTRLALDWVGFICDDCVPSDRKTFRWAVAALEFAMIMTRGQNILSISEQEYARLRAKVAGCMSLLISHFDIMGARSTLAARQEKQRLDAAALGKLRLDVSRLKDDEESSELVREQWLEQLAEIERLRREKEAERQALGHVLEDSNEADRALTYLSSSATNVTLRWQQGVFVGGGTFGSVYAAINLDTGHFMAVKEIRLQDPQAIPTIVSQIRDEMSVLQVLDHPNIVSYYGIEPHRDKVYIFMEYCSGGSLASLLEHGRIEDETVTMFYAFQMLEGLAYLHESGVVHRDIKPENILLDHNGVIKFVDFGAAKVIARQGGRTFAPPPAAGAAAAAGGSSSDPSTRGRQKSMTGTPMYMSPEVIKGSTSSAPHGAVDIWSLGCVILEMATGRRPWATLDNEWAIMYNIAQGTAPQLPARDQLSAAGTDFLTKCFERDPAKRATAVELLQHEWMVSLRAQLSFETAGTPSSEGGSSAGVSRQSSSIG